MKIKEIFPKFKEVVIKKDLSQESQPKSFRGEMNFFDVFSYKLDTDKYDANNYLWIIVQITTGDPALSYIPNLIASFIKRGFYENQSFSEENLDKNIINLPKGVELSDNLENSLKKTNLLIDDLIKNNKIKANIGVCLFNQEKIFASKIGMVKLFLVRDNKLIDVFENITLFSRVHFSEKRFSNIISGKILKGDKIFFFIPNRLLSSRFKYLKNGLLKYGQEEFINKLSELGHKIKERGGKENFFCCGIYIGIEQMIKEVKEVEEKEILAKKIKDNQAQLLSTEGFKKNENIKDEKIKKIKIFPGEVARITKGDKLKYFLSKFKLAILGLSQRKRKFSFFIVLISILIILGTLFIINILKESSNLNRNLAEINEKLKIAESKFILGKTKEARVEINDALKQLKEIEDKRKLKIVNQARIIFNKIEKLSQKSPSILFENLKEFINDPRIIIAYGDRTFIYGIKKEQKQQGEVFEIKQGSVEKISDFEDNINLAKLKYQNIILVGEDIRIFNLATKNIKVIPKKFNFLPLDLGIYYDNLYFLGEDRIYKITNALKEPISESDWMENQGVKDKNLNQEKFISFDLSSKIWVLTQENKIKIFYKGKLNKEINLDFNTDKGDKIFVLEDGKEIFVYSAPLKIIRHLENEDLKESFDLSPIGIIKDITLNPVNSTFYILSPDSLWKLNLE